MMSLFLGLNVSRDRIRKGKMSSAASSAGSDADADELPFPRDEEPSELDPDGDDLVFQVLDWYIPESDKAARKLPRPPPDPGSRPPPPGDYDMYLFGATAEGQSVCAKVIGFQPSFYIRPPSAWWKKMNSMTEELRQNLLFAQIPKTFRGETYMGTVIPKKLREHLVKFKPIKRKDFWGFTNGRDFPFIHVQVRSLALFNALKWHFNNLQYADEAAAKKIAERTGAVYDRDKVDTFRLYESNIDPFLRFTHERQLSPSGWVRVPAGTYEFQDDTESGETYTRAVHNVVTEYTNVYPHECNQVAPLIIASWDIECTSSHGDFPIAQKNYQKLALNLIQAAKRRASTAALASPNAPMPDPISSEQIAEWIAGAFARPACEQRTEEGVVIHPVYPKAGWVTARTMPQLRKVIDTTLAPKVAVHLENAAKIRPARGGAAANASATAAEDDDESDDEAYAGAGAPTTSNDAEFALTSLLDKFLPPIEGDPLIQIGTTVQRYGSDEIIFKHICVLGSCDPIPGAVVETYETEEEVILGWRDALRRLDPDLLIGYNVFGFDHNYLWHRAQELQIADDLAVGLGRIRDRTTTLLDQRLSSSALGDNFLYYLDIDGVVQIDMLKVMQRDHKLDSFKLDHVAATFLGDNKNDLKPREIFEKFQGTSADRAEIAVYCLQDCALVNRLLTKLKIIENTVGMSAVCSVPLSYLFMRGQGVKIFSLVSKECRERGYVIPTLRGFREDDPDVNPEDLAGYEGAIVLPPKEGMYLSDPITVFDYASLYPSSMIERNLSHDCYVRDPQYLGLESEGISYITVTYDVYEGVGDKKRLHSTNPSQSCTFAQLPEGKKGIIPSILMKLLNARKTTRKKIEYETLTLTDGREVTGLVVRKPSPAAPPSDPDAPGTSRAAEATAPAPPPAYTLLNVDTGDTTVVAESEVASKRQTYNSFEQAVLDALQLAYKVTANSLYGQIGARTSPIFWKDIAACTTATGRERIIQAKNFMEKEYGAETIYGDSVSGDTAILVRYPNGRVDIKTMETLSEEWEAYANFKPWDPERRDKQQAPFQGEVWTNGHWSPVMRVIRHKVNKKMYRVNTFQGCADLTEDHSLLGLNGKKVRPGDLIVKESEIAHSFPTEFPEEVAMLPRYVKASANTPAVFDMEEYECKKCHCSLPGDMFYYNSRQKSKYECKMCVKERTFTRLGIAFDETLILKERIYNYDVPERVLTKEEAWVMGYFFGDGSCGDYRDSCGKASWAINNSNLDFHRRAMEYLHKVEPANVVTFKILDTMESSSVYKLVAHGSVLYMVRKYRPLFYDKDDFKRVPDLILNASREIKEWFLQGYLTADGAKAQMALDRACFACKGKIGAMGLYTILRALGRHQVRVNINPVKENTYFLGEIVDQKYWDSQQNKVMKVFELPDVAEGQYVYDLETTEGIFGGAGVGAPIYMNTDSCFLKFPNIDTSSGKKLHGFPALAMSIKTGQTAAKAIKPFLPAPQSLEYEKTLFPFILFSKKRYVGNLYEDDPNKKPKQKSMGIVLKRRDNAQIVKTIYGGIIDILLNKNDIHASVAFFHDQIRALVRGETPLSELIITKTLKGEYKDPLKIAHKVLADRMTARDPGNKPMPSDRIPFVYIRPPPDVNPATLRLQGDRIEHPDYIREQGLTPDYRFYLTNQLLKPICQMYALCVNDLPGYSYGASYWEQMDEELLCKKIYGDNEKKRKDRLTALKMSVVEELLFEPYLTQLPDLYKPEKSTLGAAAARARARAEQELSLPGAFRSPTHEADDDENPAEREAIRRRIARDAAKLTLSVMVEKETKSYKCIAKFYAPPASSAAPATATATEPLWSKSESLPQKKGRTKQMLYQRLAEETLAVLYDDDTHRTTLTENGLCIGLADKTVLTTWRKAIAEAPTMMADIQKAAADVDLSRMMELQKNFTFFSLVSALDQIPYLLEPVAEPASKPAPEPAPEASTSEPAVPPPAKRARKKATPAETLSDE